MARESRAQWHYVRAWDMACCGARALARYETVAEECERLREEATP